IVANNLLFFFYVPEGGVSDQVDRAMEYIQMLKTNLEIIKNKKEKLSSKKRLNEHTKMINNECKPIDIQIHDMSHDVDVVLITGLNDYTSFCDVVLLLAQYTNEVTHANFSSSELSIFYIRQKKVEAQDIYKRLRSLLEGTINMRDLMNNCPLLYAPVPLPEPGWGSRNESRPQGMEELEIYLQNEGNSVSYFNELGYESLNLSIWDFDFQSNACEDGGPSKA
nr:achaete-scute transcription factor-related protein [Tanacetum cinerariifolium]